MLSLVALTAAYQAPVVSHLASSRSAFVGVTPAVPEVAAARTSAITMGGNIKELRERVGSVKNTKKITSAMRLVAAAKVRRAQEAVLRSRPFSETLELARHALATLGVGADSVREEEDGGGAAASDAALLLELQPADGGTAGAALQLRFDEAAERRRWARTISRWIVEGARPWWRTGEP